MIAFNTSPIHKLLQERVDVKVHDSSELAIVRGSNRSPENEEGYEGMKTHLLLNGILDILIR